MNLISMAQQRARLVLATLAFILLAGAAALVSIPKESEPDIQIPTLYIGIPLPGVSPSDAVTLLLRPTEQQLRTIEGVKEIRSSAYEGGSNIQIEFNPGFDSKKALSDVREAVSKAKASYPSDAYEPYIMEINLSLFPVISILMYGDTDERTMLELARRLQDAIKSIPEVLSADIFGDRDKQVEILMSPIKMEALGLRSDQLLTALSQSNLLVAAGALSDGSGKYAIKVPGLIQTPEELFSLPLKIAGERVVTLRDVADVRYNFKDQQTASFVDGKPSLTIQVKKRTGENMLSTIAKVKAVVKEAEKQLPAGLQLKMVNDKSERIHDMLTDLTNSVVSAIILVVAVIMGFLGFRDGLLVGVSVPGSFLGGILAIYLGGLSMNVVVLFALILSVGMLVDDAIIVCEYAARRIEQGMSRRRAYWEASTRMAWPITTSTLTKIIVFVPLLFWPGIIGQFMRYLPLTLIAVLTASLIFALLFLPVLGTELKKVQRIFIYLSFLTILTIGMVLLFRAINLPSALGGVLGFAFSIYVIASHSKKQRQRLAEEEQAEAEKDKRNWGELQEEVPNDRWHNLYIGVLKKLIMHPVRTVLMSVGMLFLTFGLYAGLGKGVDFFPNIEPEQFSLTVAARGNLSIQDKIQLVRQVEKIVLAYKNEKGGIDVVNTLITSQSRGSDVDTIGEISVALKNWKERPSADYIIEHILPQTSQLAGVIVRTKKENAGPKAAKPISVDLYGNDINVLRQEVARVKNFMEQDKNLTEVTDDLPPPSLNWELKIDREGAARYGANVATVGTFVKLVTQGVKIGTIRTDDSDKEVDVMVRYPEQYRGLSGLDAIRVNTAKGSVPLSYLVERNAVFDEGILNRSDQKLSQTISSNVVKGALPATEIKKIQTWLDSNKLANGVSYAFKGDDENQKQAQSFLSKAFIVAIFLIAAVMLLQFNSFSTCLFILTAVVMSTAGVLIGLLLTGQPFGVVMCGLGVISLAGIIVNNNIVLIDTYDHHRHQGIEPLRAILLAGGQRLRPVFLTSACTVLGLLPIVLSTNIDFVNRAIDIGGPSSQWWVQLATAIAFGMVFATPFTLLVTPCLLVAREQYFGYLPSASRYSGKTMGLGRMLQNLLDNLQKLLGKHKN